MIAPEDYFQTRDSMFLATLAVRQYGFSAFNIVNGFRAGFQISFPLCMLFAEINSFRVL
jgi:hypothetical protein